MEPGTEEYELNGDLRPGSPGSPDASVRPQHPLPRPLCDLGWRRPLWARLSSGHLWVNGPSAHGVRTAGWWWWPLPPGKVVLNLTGAQVVGSGASAAGGQRRQEV